MLIFWVVTPCELVGGYQRFGGTYYIHLQDFDSRDKGSMFSEKLVPTY
jgi:hypothetical protein